MRFLITFTLFLAFSVFAVAQDVYSRFYDALQDKDSAAIEESIKEIRSSGGQSAERIVAEYNYYVNKALIYSGVVTSSELPDNGNPTTDILTIMDSNGNPAGYMYFAQQWDSTCVDSGLAVINRGIVLYPDRLDLRFGKIHFLRQLYRWNDFAQEIHATIDHSSVNNSRWIFPDNDEPGDTILIYGVLDYERSLFEHTWDQPLNDTNTMNNLMLLRGIAEHMLQRYPKDVFSMNMMAVTYQLVEDRQNALEWLKKAEKVNPKDIIVLQNIADTYHELGNTRKERKYLKKIIKYGSPEDIERAKQYIEELYNR